MMKQFVHYLLFIILFVFQTTISKYITFLGVFPNLVFVYVICLCLIFTDVKSIVLSTIAGLALDLHGGMAIGFNALFYMYFSIATAYFGENFFRGRKVVTLLYTAVATILYELVYYVLFFAIWNRGGSFNNVTYILFVEMLCNIILVLPIYSLVKKTDLSGLKLSR